MKNHYRKISSFTLLFASLFIFCMFPAFSFAQLGTYEEKIPTLATEIATELSTSTGSIGMTNFTDMNGNVVSLGKLFAEEFSAELMGKATNLSVIDRTRIHFLLEKEGITVAQLANPTKAKKIARQAKSELMVLGKIIAFHTHVRLAVKVLNLKTGQVTATAKTNIQRTPVINELLLVPIESANTPAQPQRFEQHLIEKGGRNSVIEEETSRLEAHADITDLLYLPATTTVNGLDFVLQKCKRVGRNVICLFTLVNRSGDVKLKIDDKDARVLDHEGQYYAAQTFQIDNSARGPYLSKILTTGTPVVVQVVFKNIPTDLKKIEKFEWAYYAGRTEKFELKHILIE